MNQTNNNKLVVYYSLTGKTKRVAEALAITLDCPAFEIVEDKKRGRGLVNIVGECFEALAKKSSGISPVVIDPAVQVLFIGCPVWASLIPPALRSFLKQADFKGKKVVLFATSGSGEADSCFSAMNGIVAVGGGDVIHRISISSKGSEHDLSIRIKDMVENLPYNKF
jgi:flavodoxin